jgi:hypothetical protein
MAVSTVLASAEASESVRGAAIDSTVLGDSVVLLVPADSADAPLGEGSSVAGVGVDAASGADCSDDA